MKQFIYKTIVAIIAVVLVYELTISKVSSVELLSIIINSQLIYDWLITDSIAFFKNLAWLNVGRIIDIKICCFIKLKMIFTKY